MNFQALLDDLRRHEGFRDKPYYDTEGKLTVGYGRNLNDVGIRKTEADFMLRNDAEQAVSDLDRAFVWWRDLPEPAQCGLANMCFNLGLPRLLKFEKMLDALQAGDMEKAAVEALDSKWARQVKGRAQEIAEMIRSAG